MGVMSYKIKPKPDKFNKPGKPNSSKLKISSFPGYYSPADLNFSN